MRHRFGDACERERVRTDVTQVRNVVQKRGTRPPQAQERRYTHDVFACLLYTSDAADE